MTCSGHLLYMQETVLAICVCLFTTHTLACTEMYLVVANFHALKCCLFALSNECSFNISILCIYLPLYLAVFQQISLAFMT